MSAPKCNSNKNLYDIKIENDGKRTIMMLYNKNLPSRCRVFKKDQIADFFNSLITKDISEREISVDLENKVLEILKKHNVIAMGSDGHYRYIEPKEFKASL